MEGNAYCSTCNKDYVFTDFKQMSCPYCKGQKKEIKNTRHPSFDQSAELAFESYNQTVDKALKLLKEVGKYAISLKDFKDWLDNYITEQENLSSSFTYENKDNDIGSLYTFHSKLETLREIRDKLNQIEEVNEIRPLKWFF